MRQGITVEVIFGIVVILHFIVGIGYLMYKLSSPSKKKNEKDKSSFE